MRLKNIYRILKEVEPQIEDKTVEKTSNNEYEIKNWPEILTAVEKLQSIEMFKDIGQKLFNISPIFGVNNESIKITSQHVSAFNNWLKSIKDQTNTIIELCESVGYGVNEGNFEVKLPETNDFSEFSSNLNDFNKVIQLCPFIKAENSNIELTKTDIGSTWLEFAIKGGEVVPILIALGYFVKSALIIKSMHLTCQQQKEAIRGAQIKNELAEEITRVYKDMIKAAATNEVKNLEESLNMPLDHEERTSAEKSLEILGKLMSKGLEAYSSFDTPPEAKDVFPSKDLQQSIPGPTKLLSQKSD